MSHPSGPTAGVERRWWPRALLILGALLLALVFGITTASVESSLGPHEARYDVTTDDTVTVDLGPLGTLQIDSPLPLTLGVRVTVQEIPASVTQLDQSRTLQALSGDLQSYLQFFSGPQATVQDVARALVTQALWRTALAFVVLVAAWWLVRLPARRGRGARSSGSGCARTCGPWSSRSSSSPSSPPCRPRASGAAISRRRRARRRRCSTGPRSRARA